MQELKYKIVRRSVTTGLFVVRLENGNRVLDDLSWVRFKPLVGDTGVIRKLDTGQNRMIPDAFDPE